MMPGWSSSPDCSRRHLSGSGGGQQETHQSERLTARGLAVREDDSVVPVHGGADVAARDGVVDGLVLGPSEDLVECEVLRGFAA